MSKSDKKTILVIGAGWEQRALIQSIKNEGYFIVATHPKLNADCFDLADTFYVKDSRDIPSHIAIAETHQIDAIVTDNCDYSFYTASIIASKLGLNFASIQSAIFSNDKFEQRTTCEQAAIVQPSFRRVRSIRDCEATANELAFPLILKPVDSRGTFGVTIVNSANELIIAYYDAISNSPSRTLICEKFIKGTLVTVDGFCFRNGHQALAVASRKFEDGPKPVTKEIIYPARFSKSLNKKLLENHNKVAKALNYEYGHTHGEYIVNQKEEIFLVECTNRGGGVYTSSVIVPLLTGIDLNKILTNQSLNQDNFTIGANPEGFMTKSIILTFLDFQVGRVIRNINLTEMTELPYTVRFRSVFGPHDMVESVENCASRHAMLVLEGSNIEDALQNLQEFKDKLTVNYYN
ncbi:MAG: ATP-grasp domain-containing protein [Phormidesmis sp. FL-bin-119]|nr:ATP-grasp domain-containing protein [Pedobacter sp.]